MMRAAVVTRWGAGPVLADFPDPVAQPGEQVVDILAAGVHPIVRSLAAGSHYGSAGQLPMIPGVDAIGRLPDGRPAYIGFARAPYGTLSERTVLPAASGLPLPESDVSPTVFAATLNPAAAAWLALAHQGELLAGETVLVLGATGASGQLAVQLARELGAGRVVAAGRNTSVLDRLLGRGADAAVRVDTDPVDLRAAIADAAAGPVHVIIDYLWGPPTEAAIAAITHAGLRHTAPRVRLVEVGEMAGPTISLPASVLRSSGLRILGSGAGSVDPAVVVAALSRIMPRIADGSLRVPVRQARLDDVVQAWAEPDRDGERLVVVP
jgi:NADPH:quinone reductase-like Zn-dependent oxidoreductase